MTKVKICGVTTPEAALRAADAGAALIGLHFTSESPRILGEAQALAIAEAVRTAHSGPAPALVGVFVNETNEHLREVASACLLDWIQLSGEEPWEQVADLGLPAIKALHVGRDDPAAEVLERVAEGQRWLGSEQVLFLLDARVPGRHGGTGERTSWAAARLAAQRYPVLLAGGLTPDSVFAAVREVQPWGVDVSSGVEVTRGLKDPALVERFVGEVARADATTPLSDEEREGRVWGQ